MLKIGEIPSLGKVAKLSVKSDFAAIACDAGNSVEVFPTTGPGKFSTIARLANHPTVVDSLCWDPHSDHSLVTGCQGGSVWLWDVATETQQSIFPGHRSNCTSLAFHPFGNFFASGSADSNIKIWDTRTAKCIQTYRSHMCTVTSLTFSPHGRWLASGDEDGVIRMFDLSSGKELCCLESHTGQISCLDFHPTDFFFISGSVDRTIKLWTCESGFELAGSSEPETTPVRVVKFNQHGNGLTVVSDDCLKRFELNSELKRIACVSADQLGWKRVLDACVRDDGVVTAVANTGERGLSIWSTDPGNTTKKSPKKVLTPIMTASDSGDEVVVSRKENRPPPIPRSPSSQSSNSSNNCSSSSGVKSVLNKRLIAARTIASMWTSGNPRTAIDEAISSDDPFVFISLLNAVANERSRVGLSIDSCSQILSHVLDIGLLALPYSPSPQFISQCQALPFSKKIPLASSSGEARAFSSSQVNELSSIVSSGLAVVMTFAKRLGPTLVDIRKSAAHGESNARELAREDRAEKAERCLEQFESIGNIVRVDLKSTRLLKREKEELLTEIMALIQS